VLPLLLLPLLPLLLLLPPLLPLLPPENLTAARPAAGRCPRPTTAARRPVRAAHLQVVVVRDGDERGGVHLLPRALVLDAHGGLELLGQLVQEVGVAAVCGDALVEVLATGVAVGAVGGLRVVLGGAAWATTMGLLVGVGVCPPRTPLLA